MSGEFFLDWSILAVTLFNTMLLFWLGLTVLLNAERRTLGIWLAGGGLLMGGVFFLSHTAIVGNGLNYFSQGVNFWWHVGWIPVILAPFAWYVVMLWYAGYWEDIHTPVHRRHRTWLGLLSLLTIGMIALLIFAKPIPSISQIAQYNLSAAPSVMGMPVLVLVYPVFILACLGLSLDALLRPGPTVRVMGQQARQRARPWLMAASAVFLLVSVLVGVAMLWVIFGIRQHSSIPDLARLLAWADLLIAMLIAMGTLLTGQAMVSYEVFTGKALPRRGLQHYWQRAIILAVGYSIAVSLSLNLSVYPIYSVLLSTLLMVAFYALLSWRSYADRERFISSLRPFVASQQLYEQLRSPSAAPADVDIQEPFHALCEQVLGAQVVYLVPLGPSTPLFGPPLAYPPGTPPLSAGLSEFTAQSYSPQNLYIPLEPKIYGESSWAVPLWGERGLTGVLLLGEKQDGGLYTQEEIEIARVLGERLIDLQVSAEMARRLMALQRQQFSESQVLDRRTRRTLHDDVLPHLHAAMLNLGQEETAKTQALLANIHHQIADLLRELPAAIAPEVSRLGLVGALRQLAEGELKDAFNRVTWQISPEAEEKIDKLSPLSAEVVYYATREAIRNAARHARQPDAATSLDLNLAMRWQDGLEIDIEDNGIGLSQSQTKEGGTGQGLALHSTLLAVIGGSLSIESTPGFATRVILRLPAGF